MRILSKTVYSDDNHLWIELPLVRDESVNWNINIGYTDEGIGETPILDAQNRFYPLQMERVHAEAA